MKFSIKEVIFWHTTKTCKTGINIAVITVIAVVVRKVVQNIFKSKTKEMSHIKISYEIRIA